MKIEINNLEDKKMLFEQYKLCVEMADKVSARRERANVFFLGIQTSLVGLYVLTFKMSNGLPYYYQFLIPFFGIATIYVWYRIISSYRQLNDGKWKVIEKLESNLPAQPFGENGEWSILGKGHDTKLYRPLTNIEKLIPYIFGVFYLFFIIISFI